MARCLIALGSNLGDRQAAIAGALERLQARGLRVVARSQNYATAPIGGPANQGQFLNAAAIVDTHSTPQDVLAQLLEIESELGRVRQEPWGARTIDLDLLLYDDQQVTDRDATRHSELRIPHPRLAFRRFVLVPAAEIAPDWMHPESGWSISKLLQHLDQAANYAAICDVPAGNAAELANILETQTACRLLRLGAEQESASNEKGLATRIAKATTLLKQTVLPAAHEQWLVSDFWMYDSLVHGTALNADANQLRQWEQIFADPELTSYTPKLLIVLQDGWQLERIVKQYYSGPLLQVSADLESAAREVIAALQGMTRAGSGEF